MNPTVLGVIGPGFLNQIPTLLVIQGPRLKLDRPLMETLHYWGTQDVEFASRGVGGF